ncbi:hypothetical protein, partial [Lactiplantibacillus plantarum]|uniref:hypothetical protein n=1 Tax=Lactiplantibacillus plantarum TaxID=1590 RepID=UPI00217D86C9
IRSKSKIKFESNNLLFVLKDPNVRIRLFVYNRSGAFETVTKWFNDKEAYTVDTSKLYRIEINTIDDKALDLEYGYSACKIVYQNEKISNFDTLEDELTNINNTVSDRFDYNETAVNLGYRRFVTFPVEGGGIISTTGNNIDDHASIRSKSKIKFE